MWMPSRVAPADISGGPVNHWDDITEEKEPQTIHRLERTANSTKCTAKPGQEQVVILEDAFTIRKELYDRPKDGKDELVFVWNPEEKSDQFECPFSLHSKTTPNAPALISSETMWSYQECEKWIQGMALSLIKAGVREKYSVAIVPTRDFPTPLVLFALFRIGAVCSLMSPSYPSRTLPQHMKAFHATFLLYPDGHSVPKMSQPSIPFSRILKQATSKAETFLNKSQLATYLLTSGTTGTPKIVCHTLGNHYYSAKGSASFIPIGEGDRYHLSLPLNHIAGVALIFRTFLGGAAVALGENVQGITHLSLVPTQLKRLLERNQTSSCYKHILLGGAPISPFLYKQAIEKGLPVHPTYGMTEMSSQIVTNFDPTNFSLGHPLPHRILKIKEGGLICVKGKTLFKGYLNIDGSFDLPLDEEGYFQTNDLGTYCPKIGLHVFGRKDRLFISGGENIHPEEIENHLLNLKGVIRALVLPVADAEYGFRPHALIESEIKYRGKELEDHLGLFLPKFKIPIIFKIFDLKTIIV